VSFLNIPFQLVIFNQICSSDASHINWYHYRSTGS